MMNDTPREMPPKVDPLPDRLRVLYPFTSRWLELGNGERLHTIDEGAANADHAVLMVHGNPSWSFLYRDLILRLRPETRCAALDHLGCGLSSRPKRMVRLREHQSNCREWIESLHLQSFDLVVHDWGGAIALGPVLEHFTSRLRRVVILNTAAFPSKRIPLRIAVCKLPILGPLLIRGGNTFARAAVKMAVHQPLPAAVQEGFLWPYRRPGSRRATSDFVRDIPLGSWHPSFAPLLDLEQRLPGLAQKEALICWGLRDFCFNHHFLERWKKELPAAKAIALPDAGHYVLEDLEADQWNQLTGFLSP